MWFALWLLACGPDENPSIAFLSPSDGDIVCGIGIPLEFEIENFTLVPISDGSDAHPGEGHIDLSVNGQSADMGSGTSMQITLEPGEWQIMAELVNADHTSVEPYTADIVYITVDNTLCP